MNKSSKLNGGCGCILIICFIIIIPILIIKDEINIRVARHKDIHYITQVSPIVKNFQSIIANNNDKYLATQKKKFLAIKEELNAVSRPKTVLFREFHAEFVDRINYYIEMRKPHAHKGMSVEDAGYQGVAKRFNEQVKKYFGKKY